MDQDPELQNLGRHLEGIQGALRSLAKHLARRGDAAAVQSRLEWAASHLHQAIRDIQGEPFEAEAHSDPESGERARSGSGDRDMQTGLMDGLRGTTRSITLSEILGFIATLRKTGVLRVSTQDESFLVQLEDGHVVYAQADSPPPGQRLGEVLVARGALTRELLDRELLDRELLGTRGSEQVLGRRLVDAGLVPFEELKQALAFQIQCIFHRLFHARGALFQFDESVQVIRTDDVRLNVTSLLLESARSSDELAVRQP